MNLLFVSHYPAFGGPHNRALQLAGPLKQNGWTTTVLLPDEPGNARERFEQHGIEVVTQQLGRLRATPSPIVQARSLGRFIPDIRRIQSTIRERSIDVVIIGGLANPHAAIAAERENVPLIWQIVDSRTPRLLRRIIVPYAVRTADVIMTTGSTIGIDHLGEHRDRIDWIPFFSPVDTERFRPNSHNREAARVQLGVRDDQILVGSVGNIGPQKGFEYLIEAVGRLKRRGSPVELRILGSHLRTHDRYRQRLYGLIRTEGLATDPSKVIVDPEAHVAELLTAFDVFALSSVPASEGVPTAIMEALATGLPVVATNVGGVQEVVENGVTGFVVPPLDPDAIASAIEALAASPNVRAQMALAARDDALKRFDTRYCLESHLRALSIASSRKQHRADHFTVWKGKG